MDFDIGAADADFASGSVNCRTMELNVGAGELTGADFAVTGTLDIKLGAGDIDLEGGTYKDIKLDCGMGSFALDGIVAENVKAHCGMGDGSITLRGREEDNLAWLEKLHPLFMDSVPLTLEEIFIYELGGVDDAVRKNVL